MSDNTLFNYLSDRASAPVIDSIENLRREEKTNRSGIRYFLLDMKKCPDEVIKGFTVINHHISVYEHGDEYHYTAELTDVDGDQFRLHVYFNHKGEVTKLPFFEIKNDQDEYIHYAAEQYDKALIKLAKDTTQPIIKELKEGIKRHIQILETAYTTIEAQACDLSRTVSENYEAYINKLDAAYRASLAIIPFADKTSIYTVRANRLEKLKKAFEHQHTIETQTRVFETQKSEDDVQSPTGAEPINPIFQTAPTVIPIYIDIEINELAERFKKLSEKKNEVEQAEELADIRAKTVEFFLRLDSSTTLASLASLALLQKLDSDTAVKGRDLYNRLLITRHVDGLRYLPNFHHLIEDKYLEYALVKKDDKFLNFVIECGDYDINHPITVRGTRYLSAAHYCFDAYTDETPMAACLSVLLNRGGSASLFVPNADGLPIAYAMLSRADHSLREVMFSKFQNDSQAIANFLRELISALEEYLVQDPDDKKRKNNEVKRTIAKSKEQISQLQSGLVSPRDFSLFAETEAALREHLGKETDINRLDSDPVIVQERERMIKALDKLTKVITPKEARACSLRSREDIKRRYSQLKEKSFQGVEYPKIRREAIAEIVDHRKQYERAYELQMLKKEIQRYPMDAKTGKPGKNQQRLLTRATQLNEETIAFYRKYYPNEKDVEKGKKMLDMIVNMMVDIMKERIMASPSEYIPDLEEDGASSFDLAL